MAKSTAARSTSAKAAARKSPAKKSSRNGSPASIAKAEKGSKAGFGSKLQAGLEKIAEGIEHVFAGEPADIVAAIKMDHDSLREFLDVLKDTDRDMEERRRAYASFSALLKSHSDSEEKAVYATVDAMSGREMHIKVAEGYVEHQVASDLMKRIESTKDPMAWSAHANVLSESVAHHLREEENELLPKIRRGATPEVDEAMLAKFLSLRGKSQKKVTKKNAGVLKQA